MKARAWMLAAAGLGLAACGGSQPAGMPEGYSRVNDAFGVRMEGLVDVNGEQRAPVVEFRANGDYAMYPVITDCEGNLRREAGLVFASDGTVREQVPEQAVETVKGSPQFGPVVDAICAPSRKALAAVKDDAANRRTRHGLMRIEGERGSQRVMLKRQQVATGESLAFVATYRLGNDDVVLVHERDTGNACPGGHFGLIAVNAQGARLSDPFGTCVEGATPTAVVVSGGLDITLAGTEGPERFRYASGIVEYVPREREPELADADASLDAAEVDGSDGFASAPQAEAPAPERARTTPAAANVKSKPSLQSTWAAACTEASRRVTTPAGSIVGLSASEAARYCDCLWQRAPADAGQAVRGGALAAPASELLPQAHAACIRSMI